MTKPIVFPTEGSMRLCRSVCITVGAGVRLCATLACATLACAGLACAGEPSRTTAEDRQPKATASTNSSGEGASASADDIEVATMQFVREHQPELGKLLEFLKSRQSADYRQAINESSKVRNRLRGLKDRDPELYEVELAHWKKFRTVEIVGRQCLGQEQKAQRGRYRPAQETRHA